jgi:hypothetical protein
MCSRQYTFFLTRSSFSCSNVTASIDAVSLPICSHYVLCLGGAVLAQSYSSQHTHLSDLLRHHRAITQLTAVLMLTQFSHALHLVAFHHIGCVPSYSRPNWGNAIGVGQFCMWRVRSTNAVNACVNASSIQPAFCSEMLQTLLGCTIQRSLMQLPLKVPWRMQALVTGRVLCAWGLSSRTWYYTSSDIQTLVVCMACNGRVFCCNIVSLCTAAPHVPALLLQ